MLNRRARRGPKGPKKSGSGAPQKPAAPGQVEPGTGEPGSDAARKAYADFQKANKDQGGDKPNKGKGKGKNDRKSKGKNDSKQSKGAATTRQ